MLRLASDLLSEIKIEELARGATQITCEVRWLYRYRIVGPLSAFAIHGRSTCAATMPMIALGDLPHPQQVDTPDIALRVSRRRVTHG